MSALNEYPPDDAEQWYVLRGARIQGPYTHTEVQRYILLGRIGCHDRISQDGHTWHLLHTQHDVIPQALHSIHTEEGWRAFLRAKLEVDERSRSGSASHTGEHARSDEASQMRAFRQEWLEMLKEQRPENDSTQATPFTPLFLLLLTLFVVLGLYWLTLQ
ncbi:MAG: hypothetical protein AAF434_05535 [Pseudomonadota bacterium]